PCSAATGARTSMKLLFADPTFVIAPLVIARRNSASAPSDATYPNPGRKSMSVGRSGMRAETVPSCVFAPFEKSVSSVTVVGGPPGQVDDRYGGWGRGLRVRRDRLACAPVRDIARAGRREHSAIRVLHAAVLARAGDAAAGEPTRAVCIDLARALLEHARGAD